MLFIDLHALSLAIRSLVPIQPKPVHAGDDRLDKLLGRAALIRILYAEDEHPLMAAGKEPVEQGGPHAADMEMACGTWGKPDATLIHHNINIVSQRKRGHPFPLFLCLLYLICNQV